MAKQYSIVSLLIILIIGLCFSVAFGVNINLWHPSIDNWTGIGANDYGGYGVENLTTIINTGNIGVGFQLSTPDDDFSDGNRGWQWIKRVGGSNETTEQNGRLEIVIAADGVKTSGYTSSMNIPAGNFDIQIDFSNFTNTTGNDEGSLRMLFQVDSTHFFGIGREVDQNDGQNWYQRQWRDGGGTTTTEANTTDTSGKLRLVRIDDNLYTYYHDGTNWQQLGAVVTGISATLKDAGTMQIYGLVRTGSDITVYVDNYTVNTGDFYTSTSPVINSPEYSCNTGSVTNAISINVAIDNSDGTDTSAMFDIAVPPQSQGGSFSGVYNSLSWVNSQLLNAPCVNGVTHEIRIQIPSDGTQQTKFFFPATYWTAIGNIGSAGDYPVESNVLNGVSYNSGALVGNYVTIDAADVCRDITYGPLSNTTGTRKCKNIFGF